jgi:hypothetical protein
MKAPRRSPTAAIAVGVALAALAATLALAQSQDAARTIANGESLIIDGHTFSITPGTSNNDLADQIRQLGARPLGAGVVIFRSGDGLYILDRAALPPIAAIPRNSTVECGRGWALRDQGAYSPPNPNEKCQHISGLRDADVERQRPFVPRDTAGDRQRPHGLGDAGIAPDDIAHMAENPRIHIEYQTPKDPTQQNVYETVRQRHMLEMVRKIFSPFILGDIDLNIRTISCDGVSNAWYQRVGNVPTVSICYEYLQEIWESMPEETKEVMGATMKDAVCGQLFFAVAHELGHAMFDIFDVPVFGRAEDAADEFATYIMLQFGGDQALQLVDGAAYGYHAYIKDLDTKPQVTLPLAAFSSDHGAPEERYFNLICIAYGYDERLFRSAMDKIPPSRAKKCKFEYEDLKFAMRTVFWPHLDHEKVRRVLAMKWFVDANANTSTSTAN